MLFLFYHKYCKIYNVLKKKTGKYNIVMVVNILYTKGVKQNYYARIVYPA